MVLDIMTITLAILAPACAAVTVRGWAGTILLYKLYKLPHLTPYKSMTYNEPPPPPPPPPPVLVGYVYYILYASLRALQPYIPQKYTTGLHPTVGAPAPGRPPAYGLRYTLNQTQFRNSGTGDRGRSPLQNRFIFIIHYNNKFTFVLYPRAATQARPRCRDCKNLSFIARPPVGATVPGRPCRDCEKFPFIANICIVGARFIASAMHVLRTCSPNTKNLVFLHINNLNQRSVQYECICS